MRLAAALLFVALTATSALADEAKPADSKPEVTKKKVPFRVVTILPETRQVLMFDKNTGGYVVAEVGQTLEGYRVDEIDEDEVTLIAESGTQVILAGPSTKTPPAPTKAAPATPAAEAPLDPYADGKAAEAPVDPYSDGVPAEAPKAPGEGGVRVATATGGVREATPDNPYPDPVAAFADAVGIDPPAPEAKATPDVKTPEVAASPAKPAPTTPAGAVTIPRAELDAALADFGALAGSFRAQFTAEGLRFDAINDGTILAKAGLKTGDVVTAVDKQPLRSLDDAANLYARAGTVRNTTISVLRAGKPVSLRVTFQ